MPDTAAPTLIDRITARIFAELGCEGITEEDARCAARAVAEEVTALDPAEKREEMGDAFEGDTPHLLRAIDALLFLDAEGALIPHGIGGHARTLLSAAAVRLARTSSTEARLAVVDEDARLYRRLRILGCAPDTWDGLERGEVLRFTNLDAFIDADIKAVPSRGEFATSAPASRCSHGIRSPWECHECEQTAWAELIERKVDKRKPRP